MACYWFQQGKCQLYTMEQNMVLAILKRVPQARTDILNCSYSCPDVEALYLTFASEPKNWTVDDGEVNEQHMKSVNQYRDNHRKVGGGAVSLPVIPPGDKK